MQFLNIDLRLSRVSASHKSLREYVLLLLVKNLINSLKQKAFSLDTSQVKAFVLPLHKY